MADRPDWAEGAKAAAEVARRAAMASFIFYSAVFIMAEGNDRSNRYDRTSSKGRVASSNMDLMTNTNKKNSYRNLLSI